jgi:hypothetical protein
MIGRTKPILNALGAADRATYRAHYCGICVAAKRAYGRRSTLGHSSELVLVSLLLDGLSPEEYPQRRAGCTVLPLLPRRVAMGPGPHAGAIAAGILATLQLDLVDARQDNERRIKQWLCRSHFRLHGAIDPQQAHRASFVQAAVAALPPDDVGEVVAGVIGHVFQLAGQEGPTLAAGCRIGHVLGRLMNLSDAVEDYVADVKAGKPNLLHAAGGAPGAEEVRRRLHALLDELDGWISLLPLRRHAELLESLVNVHARARVEKLVQDFQTRRVRRKPQPAAPPGACAEAAPTNDPIAHSGSADCLSIERGLV